MCHDEAAGAVECARCRTRVHAECRGARCPTLGCGARLALALTRPPVRRRRFGGTEVSLALGALALVLHVASQCVTYVRPGPAPRARPAATPKYRVEDLRGPGLPLLRGLVRSRTILPFIDLSGTPGGTLDGDDPCRSR